MKIHQPIFHPVGGIPMKCVICSKPVYPKSIYCQRCRRLIATKAESTKRRAAAIKAYDKNTGAFRCRWSGAVLDEDDPASPFHLCFDHLIPEKSSELAISAEVFNEMKSELGPQEFPLAVGELSRRHAGLPFDKDIIRFIYWTERAAPAGPPLLGSRPRREEWTPVASSDCVICGKPSLSHSIYCPRCRRFVFWGGHDHTPRVNALKKAWSPEQDGFTCHYTGVKLDDSNPESAWYLNFDHRIPGDEGPLAVAASWVNAMKTDLSEEEFWAVVDELSRHFGEGKIFDKDVVQFKYWKRKARRRP